MEPYSSPKQINGINLADYLPQNRGYNSIVYVHKNIIEQEKAKRKKDKKNKEKKDKEIKNKKLKKKDSGNRKVDKCEQCNDLHGTEIIGMNNSLLAQNVHLTRTWVPVVIPPSGIASPVYYTIKASKKKDTTRKKPKEEVSAVTHTLKKEKSSKKVIETYRNTCGKESLSVKETITSYSSQSDTLNELQINQSLCCSFSEISDSKQILRKERREKHKRDSRDTQKLISSESFEALATEFLNNAGDTKIKIHLMNETEKNLLAENIRVPVLNAIRDCILEINKQNHDAENEVCTVVQKFVNCNTQKLDSVMNKLSCIEEKIDNHIQTESKKIDEFIKSESKRLDLIKNDIAKAKVVKPWTPRVQRAECNKASTLEQLGEDLSDLEKRNPLTMELKGENSEDEYYKRPTFSARKNLRGKGAVSRVECMNERDKGAARDKEDREESGEPTCSSSGQLVRPDRPNRIPARFCWTDAAKKAAS